MIKMSFKQIFALLVFVSALYAIPVLDPMQKDVANGETIDLGAIGPGQTISISMDGRPTIGGMYGIGGTYDYAVVLDLPNGWSMTPSDFAGIPLQVKITADKYAPEGEYQVKVDVLDTMYEGLQNLSFYAKVRITYDVLDASLDSNTKQATVGQPARFYITITNKANTGDVFSVSSSNIKRWMFKKSIYVPAMSSKTIYYEVASDEQGSYSPIINIVSEASPLINKTLVAKVDMNSYLYADYKATNNGMLFFPAMSGIIYSLAGLISNLL